MKQVADVLEALEQIAPARFAFGFDHIGLQVGDAHQPVRKIALTLDAGMVAVKFAVSRGCDLIVAHHPVIWNPLERVSFEGAIPEMIRKRIAFVAAHTNWDCARGGVNDALLAELDLRWVGDFGSGAEVPMLKLVVFVPGEHAEAVIAAASKAGAGNLGNYEQCAFRSEGVGTFRGNSSTKPWVGTSEQIQQVVEVRVEMVLPEAVCWAVEAAVRGVHPYEEPAIDFIRLIDAVPASAGRLGSLAEEMPLSQFARFVEGKLNTHVLTWGDADRPIGTVGVVGGAASGEWWSAQRAGADVFLTGELKHSDAVAAMEAGFALIQAGHYATEQPGVIELARRLNEMGFDCEVFVPPAGEAGRPL